MSYQFTILSDLHLEFTPEYRVEKSGANALLLCGDICVPSYFKRGENSPYFMVAQNFVSFFEDCASKYELVFYIPGNHEFYKGYVEDTVDILREKLGHIPNLIILDDEYFDLGEIRIIGSTLWTDMNKNCPITENYVKHRMNDYNIVQWNTKNYQKLRPNETAKFHFESVQFIKDSVDKTKKNIIMSHHAPSSLSVHEKYKNDRYMNHAYYSDLSELILDNPGIVLWGHGHMHDSFDYVIGSTRVICNPKGYPISGVNQNENFDSYLNIEIEGIDNESGT